ncbi:MAG TPA: hypothetical protein VKS79_01475 [Gemmataceae bacterium]|nr:hypothetical protein [Gemmataceae bacterium]
MGWDKGRYYTRSKKVNGRVVREYIGAGEAGQLVARIDENERELKKAKRDAEHARRVKADALDASLDDFCKLAESLAHAALGVTGFHQHKGEWRKQRVGKAKH